MNRDEIDLNKLTDFQKRKLSKFYNVKSINDLDVLNDGSIVIKKSGGSAKKEVSVYLEDHDGKLHKMDLDTFINGQKDPSLGYKDVSKDVAKRELSDFVRRVLNDQKKTGELNQICIEHDDKGETELLLFQQFVIFYADKLRKVLCNSDINIKYIKATGNPGYSDVDYYNIIKTSDTELTIKGFAFCGYPSKQNIYINLICGTGGTGQIIKAMMESIEKNMLQDKPKYISLESIETEQALAFYGNLGFRKPKKDTIETINAMVASKAKTFQEYADQKKSNVGGKLYLFPHNKEGEKYLKKLKCEFIYTPVKWFDTIKQLRKEKKTTKYIKNHLIESMRTSKLEGDGIGDFFKGIYNKGKALVSNVVNRFKPKLDDFTNQSKATLAKYGDWRIIGIYIQRKPIMGILDKFFNILSFGKFEELKKKYGYDKLFHLQLGLMLAKNGQTKKITVEKNETIDITEESKSGVEPGSQVQIVPIQQNRAVNLTQMIDGTRKRYGDYTFFSYDPFSNNCQYFIRYLLETLGMYGEREKSFLFQDMVEFKKELPKWLPGFARGITDLGATVANIRGKGKPKVRLVHGKIKSI